MSGLGLNLGFVGVEVVIHSPGQGILIPIVKELFVEKAHLRGLGASDSCDDGTGEPERRFLLWPIGARVGLFVFVRR